MINSNCEKCVWHCRCNKLDEQDNWCGEFTPVDDCDELTTEDSSEYEEYREAWNEYVREFN